MISKIENKTAFIIAIILFVGTVFFFNNIIKHEKNKTQELEQLISSLQDTLQTQRGREGEHIAKISVLETENTKTFTEIKAKDEEIKKLQTEVLRYQKQLKEQGSITTIVTEVKVDTIWQFIPPRGDTVILSQEALIDSLQNEWIDVTFGFIKSNSMLRINRITNEYTVAIGRESQSWFKPSKPFVEVTSYNPYSTIQTVRTYQVSMPPPKRWGLGLQLGYGLTIQDNTIKTSPTLGLGISYNILRW